MAVDFAGVRVVKLVAENFVFAGLNLVAAVARVIVIKIDGNDSARLQTGYVVAPDVERRILPASTGIVSDFDCDLFFHGGEF